MIGRFEADVQGETTVAELGDDLTWSSPNEEWTGMLNDRTWSTEGGQRVPLFSFSPAEGYPGVCLLHSIADFCGGKVTEVAPVPEGPRDRVY